MTPNTKRRSMHRWLTSDHLSFSVWVICAASTRHAVSRAPLPLEWRTAMCWKSSLCRRLFGLYQHPDSVVAQINDATIETEHPVFCLLLCTFNSASSTPCSVLAAILSSILASRTIRRHLALAQLVQARVESAAYYYYSHITGPEGSTRMRLHHDWPTPALPAC